MLRFLLFSLLLSLHLAAAELPSAREEMIRLQIYLDQQNFGPGVIDGKMGTYTQKAIEAYNKKFGHHMDDLETIKAKSIAEIPNIYATAIVPKLVETMVDSGFRRGDNRNYQASRKDMPYRSVAEFMAERYHTSVDFLKLINPPEAVTKAKHRAALIVPNVEPFRIENLAAGRTHKQHDTLSQRWAVIDTKAFQIRIYEPLEPLETAPDIEGNVVLSDNEVAIDFDPTVTDFTQEATTPRAAIVIEDPNPEQQLTVHDEHRALIVAAYPITPGKKQFIRYGTWKMRNAIEFPTWRYDASLLKTGQRSNKSLQIPSGPNNPVGVIWMGLSRKGIGIHGTNNPDKIGRGRSAGCIRLSNWDAAKLPTLIRPGATVIIK